MDGVLAGVRVLDFGRYVAGPYAAQLLGFLGAEVIRVERREGGEDRFIHPLGEGPEGALFHHTARGKRSLTFDPGKPGAADVLRRLVASADVVVANLPPMGLKAIGIDYESLCAVRADIILVTQNSFGSVGADAGKPGFDGVGQAMSGAMWFSGEAGQPMKAAAPYVDFSTALLSAFGAMAALMERARTGRGQVVEASLLRTACAAFGAFLTEEAVLGLGRQPTGNRVQTSGPSDCVATSDGHVLVHTVGNGLFRRVARAIGREEWLADPALQTDEARGAARDRLCAALAVWAAERTRDEACAALAAAGVPAGPVLTPAEAVAKADAAGWLSAAGGVPALGLPIGFSGGAAAGDVAVPPGLGADTDAILDELGFNAEEIAALRADGVV